MFGVLYQGIISVIDIVDTVCVYRWGSSDLCLSHVHLLTDLVCRHKDVQLSFLKIILNLLYCNYSFLFLKVLNLQFTSSLTHLNIQLLLRRLVAFLTTQQQVGQHNIVPAIS